MPNKSAICFKCKGQANIKINVLKYCNQCFVSLFESKLQKNIPKICSDKSIFVYLADSPVASIIHSLIVKNFSNRPIKKLEIFSDNQNLIIEIDNRCKNIIKHDSIHDIIQYSVKNNFDVLFHFESLDSSILNSLQSLCEGKPQEAIESIVFPTQKIEIYNLLKDIKDKEITYFLYLKGIKRTQENHKLDDVSKIIQDFLYEIDDKNELAFFNYQNTFRKLSE